MNLLLKTLVITRLMEAVVSLTFVIRYKNPRIKLNPWTVAQSTAFELTHDHKLDRYLSLKLLHLQVHSLSILRACSGHCLDIISLYLNNVLNRLQHIHLYFNRFYMDNLINSFISFSIRWINLLWNRAFGWA